MPFYLRVSASTYSGTYSHVNVHRMALTRRGKGQEGSLHTSRFTHGRHSHRLCRASQLQLVELLAAHWLPAAGISHQPAGSEAIRHPSITSLTHNRQSTCLPHSPPPPPNARRQALGASPRGGTGLFALDLPWVLISLVTGTQDCHVKQQEANPGERQRNIHTD